MVHVTDLLDQKPRRRFLGLDFDPLSFEQVIREITKQANSGKPFEYVVTPNVDHMVRLDREPELTPLYNDAWLNVCDSRILELLSKVQGVNLSATPGADLVEVLVREHTKAHDPIVVIGGDEAIINDLRTKFGFTDIRWHNPPMGLRKNHEAIEDAADFLIENTEKLAFICVGSPQQELVARAAARRKMGRGVGLCCGASLEFLTGKVDRAPLWMRQSRLEWLHRLGSEPKRLWKRYLVDGPRILAIWNRTRAAG